MFCLWNKLVISNFIKWIDYEGDIIIYLWMEYEGDTREWNIEID